MNQVKKISETKLPTKYGDFLLVSFEDIVGNIHLTLIKGVIKGKKDVYVRVHSQCLTGDTLGSQRCDCGEQLDKALKLISKHGGVLLYMPQEGRGIGLLNKLKAYELQDKGMDTVEANIKLGFKADTRDYTIGAQILADLGLSSIKLLTNNPKKIEGLGKYGLKIVERIPLLTTSTKKNQQYLKTKQEKLGHFLEDKGIVH